MPPRGGRLGPGPVRLPRLRGVVRVPTGQALEPIRLPAPPPGLRVPAVPQGRDQGLEVGAGGAQVQGEGRRRLGRGAGPRPRCRAQEGVAEGRVQGQLGQDGAVRGDAPVRVHRAEGGERPLGGGHRVGRRVLGQGQPAAARGAPRRERQGHRREVDDGEGRRRGCGRGAQGCSGVAADHGAGAEAGGAARPLAGGRARGLDGDEPGHAPPPVPARLAGQARVDHEAHPRHGQRGLGDRRRDDDARHGGVGAAGERGVLVGGLLAAVQDADLGVRGERGDAPRDRLHLGHAGQEDEGVHGRVGVERLGVGARGRGRDVVEEGPVHAALGGEAVAAEGGVLLAQRVQHGRGGDHGQGRLLPHAAGPAGGQGRRVHGGGHGHERELGTQLPQVSEEGEEHVRVQVPLVDLVQDHRAHAVEPGVGQEAAQQQARGHELDGRGPAARRVAAHGVPDGGVREPSPRVGVGVGQRVGRRGQDRRAQPPPRRAHRDPARLRDQDAPAAVVREPDRERGRDHGGLARARGRLDDGRPARVQRRLEVGQGGGERQPGTEAVEGGGEGGGDGSMKTLGHLEHCA